MKNTEQQIEQRVRNFKAPAGRSKEEAWELLSGKLDQQPVKKSFSLMPYLSLGAAAIVLVMLGIFQWGMFTPVTTTAVAVQQTLWLPDSSMVMLNSQSSLKSNYQLIGGKRQLKLEGEAYFKVKKGKPFEVDFPGGRLKVLGTEFNVIAYSPKNIRIDCTEGKVKVDVDGQTITLIAGQGFHLSGNELKGPYSIEQEDVQKRLKGIYVWHEESLDEIFAYIGNRFGYTVTLDPSLQKRNFSGTFTLNSLQQSLQVLSEAMQINYTVNESLKQINIEAR